MFHARPAFDALLGMGGAGLFILDLVDLARTDLNAILTAVACLWVDHRVHSYLRFQIADFRLKNAD